MLSTERADFETHLGVLFGGYPTFLTPPRTEAYWRGLARMPLSVFVRCVDYALGESGTDKLPTVNAIWQISRNLRSPPKPQIQAQPALAHPFQGAANGALLSLLNSKGPASDDCIAKLVALKNRIVADLPTDADPAEVRDVLIQAFERIWVPMPQSEIDDKIAARWGAQINSAAIFRVHHARVGTSEICRATTRGVEGA